MNNLTIKPKKWTQKDFEKRIIYSVKGNQVAENMFYSELFKSGYYPKREPFNVENNGNWKWKDFEICFMNFRSEL